MKSELLSIGTAWFLIINPLWNRLKIANANDSVTFIEEFIKFSECIQEVGADPCSQVCDPSQNIFIRRNTDLDNSILNPFPTLSAEAFLYEQIAITQDENLTAHSNLMLKMMLKGASNYMLKLSKSWVKAYLPGANVEFPFSNQRVESFFSFVDRAVEGCKGANMHIRNRLELARSTMNGLYSYLLEMPEETRYSLISNSYSKDNRDDVIQEEQMVTEHHRLKIEAHNLMVNIIRFSIQVQ